MNDENLRFPSERELLAISDEPYEGFIQLIEILQKTYGDDQGRYSVDADDMIREYIETYLERYPDLVPVEISLPTQGEDLEEFKHNVNRARLKALARNHAKTVFSRQLPRLEVRISAEYKIHIREMVVHIRRIIDSAELPSIRKDEISSKLNAFAAEIERETSRVDRLGALWLAVTRYAGEGSKNLEPVLRLIERVRKVLGSAQDDQEREVLIEQERRRELNPPKGGGSDPSEPIS